MDSSSFSDARQWQNAVADEGKSVPDPADRLTDLVGRLDDCISDMSHHGRQGFGRWNLEDVVSNLDTLWDKLHEVKKIAEDLEDGIAQQASDIAGLQDQIDELTGRNAELQEELDAAQETVKAVPEGVMRRLEGNDYPRYE